MFTESESRIMRIKKQLKDSLILGFAVVTGIATICTVLGFSMKDAFSFPNMAAPSAVIIRIIILLFVYFAVTWLIWYVKGKKYNKSIDLKIGNNNVTIKTGNIFETQSWRVIPVDTHVETTTDVRIISESSLQGQLIRRFGSVSGIKNAVEAEAYEQNIQPSGDKYTFDIGTVIPYKENDEEYLLVVLAELNSMHEARTTLAQYETTLLRMWNEICRVYEGKPVSLPILGNGVTRFEDGRDDTRNLIRCMLCTLNTSGVHLSSKITILVYSNDEDKDSISLYEYKDINLNWI